MSQAASAAPLLAAAALWVAAAGCATSAGVSPAAGVAAGTSGAAAAAATTGAPEAAAVPSERDALLGRIVAILDTAGEDRNAHSSAQQELERYLGAHQDERQDAALALLGRLLGDFVKCAENLAEAEQRAGEARETAGRLQDRADGLARQNATLTADLAKVGRERDELKALVQRLKDLELNMEQKRKRLR